MRYELADKEGEALEPLYAHARALTVRLSHKIDRACLQMLEERRKDGRMRGVLVKANRLDVELSEDVPYGTIHYEPQEL